MGVHNDEEPDSDNVHLPVYDRYVGTDSGNAEVSVGTLPGDDHRSSKPTHRHGPRSYQYVELTLDSS